MPNQTYWFLIDHGENWTKPATHPDSVEAEWFHNSSDAWRVCQPGDKVAQVTVDGIISNAEIKRISQALLFVSSYKTLVSLAPPPMPMGQSPGMVPELNIEDVPQG